MKAPLVRIEWPLSTGGEVDTTRVPVAMVASQVLVRTADDATAETLTRYAEQNVMEVYLAPGAFIVATTAPRIDSVPQLLHDLQQLGLQPEPDYLIAASGSPEVASLAAPTRMIPVRDIPVGLVDSGVDLDHFALANGIIENLSESSGMVDIDDDANGYADDTRGWDFVDNDPEPDDLNGHGSHVAGILLGARAESSAHAVRVVPARVLDQFGLGTVSDAIAAIEYLDTAGVPVINMSWGTPGRSQLLFEAMAASPALFVAAAGNQACSLAEQPLYPAAFDLPNLLTVGAVDDEGQVAGFSNFDPYAVDILAPGVDVESTEADGGWGARSGTSMATPWIAAAAASLKSRRPGTQAAELATMTLELATPTPSLAWAASEGRVYNPDILPGTLELMGPAWQPQQTVILYDADYSIPPHTANALPLIGSNGVGSIRFGSPTVRTSVGGYNNPCLEFDSHGSGGNLNYDQVSYTFSHGASNYRVEYDIYVENMVSHQFTLLFDASTVRNVYFYPDGRISSFIGDLGTYSFGEVISMRYDFSLTNSTVDVYINDHLVKTGRFTTTHGDIMSMRFNLQSEYGDGNRVAVDNVRITANPVLEGPPELGPVPASHNFGLARIDRQASASIPIHNLGWETLEFSELTVSAPFTAEFSPPSLEYQEEGLLQVYFNPAEIRDYSGELSFVTNEPGSPTYHISLTGRGDGIPVPTLPSTDPIELSLVAGETSSSTLHLGNTGTGTLTWETYFTASGSADRLEPGWIEATPGTGTLAPDATADIGYQIDTTGLEPGEHVVDIVINTDDHTFRIPLTITVTPNPQIEVDPAELNFGLIQVGASTQMDLTITNVGTSTLHMTSIASNHPVFTVDANNLDLPAGESTAVTVVFRPDEITDYAQHLTITSDAINAPSTLVSLTGEASSGPLMTLSADTIHFTANFGISPPSQILTIGNIGETALTASFSLIPTITSAVTAQSRTYTGHTEYGMSKDELEAWVSDQPAETVTLTSTLGLPAAETYPADPLDQILSELMEDISPINSIIPSRYDFSDGITGTYISDGGSDMFDNGNYLYVNEAGPIPYSDETISSYNGVPGMQYFTLKRPGLFVFAADVSDLTRFEINGGLGADGAGDLNGITLESIVNGIRYTGFLKRVWGTTDPSVNQLVIFQSNGQASQSFPSSTNSGQQIITELDGVQRIYYLLYASSRGGYIDDEESQAIMEAFLGIVGGQGWLSLGTDSMTVAADESRGLEFTANTKDLPAGDYQVDLKINSNVGGGSETTVPVTLQVAEPPLTVEPETLRLTAVDATPAMTREITLSTLHGGTDWTLESAPAWVSLSQTSGSLPCTITATPVWDGLLFGVHRHEIVFRSAGSLIRVPVSLNYEPFNPVWMESNPYDGYLYAINQGEDESESILMRIDPETGEVLNMMVLIARVADIAFGEDGHSLYAFSGYLSSVAKVDLAAWELLAVRKVSALSTTGSLANTFRIAGQDDNLLLVDAATLRSSYHFNFETGETTKYSNSYRGDITLTANGSESFSWRYYYSSTGGLYVDQLSEDKHIQTTVLYGSSGPNSGDPKRPILISPNGTWAAYDHNLHLSSEDYIMIEAFDQIVLAASYYGDLAVSAGKIYDGYTGETLYTFGREAQLQAVAHDQRHLISYYPGDDAFTIFDLTSVRAPRPIGINPLPKNGSAMMTDKRLEWTPTETSSRYAIYVGDNRGAVAAATTESPEYLGTVDEESISLPDGLHPGQTYYWRVDVVTESGFVKSDVFEFYLMDAALIVSQEKLTTVDTARSIRPYVTIDCADQDSPWTISSTSSRVSIENTTGTGTDEAQLTIDVRDLPVGKTLFPLTVEQNGYRANTEIVVEILSARYQSIHIDPLRNVGYVLHQYGTWSLLLLMDTDTQELVDAVSLDGGQSLVRYDKGWQNAYLVSNTNRLVRQIDLERFDTRHDISYTYDNIPSSQTPDIEPINERYAYLTLGSIKDYALLLDFETGELQRAGTGANISNLALTKDGGELWAKENVGSSYHLRRYRLDSLTDWTPLEIFSTYSSTGSDIIFDAQERYLYLNDNRNLLIDTQEMKMVAVPVSNTVLGFTSQSPIAITLGGVTNLLTGSRYYTLPTYMRELDPSERTIWGTTTNAIYQSELPEALGLGGAGLRPKVPNDTHSYLQVDALSWYPDFVAYRYQVYWGDDREAVEAADTDSPLYRGETTTESIPLPTPPVKGQTFYWRVDALRGDTVVHGPVWEYVPGDFSLSQLKFSEHTIQQQVPVTQTLELNCEPEAHWNIEAPTEEWLSVSPLSGTGPASIHVTFTSENQPTGYKTTTLNLEVESSPVELPVELYIDQFIIKRLQALSSGQLAAYGVHTYYSSLFLFDPESMLITQHIRHPSEVIDMDLSPDESSVYLVDKRGSLYVWDLASGETDSSGLEGSVRANQVQAGVGHRVILRDSSYNLRFFDLESGEEFQSSRSISVNYINSCLGGTRYYQSYSSSGNSLFAYDFNETTGQYDLTWSNSELNYRNSPLKAAEDTGDVILYNRKFDPQGENSILLNTTGTLEISNNGALAASSNSLYELGSGQTIHTFNTANAVVFSTDSEKLYAFYVGGTSTGPTIDVYTLDAGNISVSPLSLTFPDTFADSQSVMQIKVTNTSVLPVTVTDLTLSGDAAFTHSTELPFTLTYGTTKVIEVQFNPVTTGSHSGGLSIVSTDEDEPTVEVSLTGTATQGPIITVTPESLAVSLVTNQSITRTLTVHNAGGAPLSYSVSDNVDWIDSGTSVGTVAPGDTQEFAVTISAGILLDGEYLGDITVHSNDPLNPSLSIPVSLYVDAEPDISVATSIDFGGILVGSGTSHDLVIKNTGLDVLSVTAAIVSGGEAFSGNTDTTIAPGEQTTLSVRYAPQSLGEHAGVLRLTTNDPDESVVEVALTGLGLEPPEIEATPLGLTFNLNAGDTSQQTLSISNTASVHSVLSVELSIEYPQAKASALSLPQSSPLPPAPPSVYPQIDPATAEADIAPLSQQAESLTDATLFACGAGNTDILRLDPLSGEVLYSIPAPDHFNGGPVGLAYDGTFLYLVNNFGDRIIYQIDPQTGEVVDTLNVSSHNIDALAHDGEYLYALDYNADVIRVFDMDAGLVRTIDPDLPLGGGLTAGGRRGTLFVSNFSIGIYEIDKVTGELINILTAPGNVYGLGYSDAAEALMVGIVSPSTMRALDPDSGELLGSCTLPISPYALASDESGNASTRHWLSLTPESDSINGQETLSVNVTANAENLVAGEYEADIRIASNDQDESEIIVPVTLHVTGAPGIVVTPQALSFDTLYLGSTASREIKISNNGTDNLIVTAIAQDNAEIATPGINLPLTIEPHRQVKLDVLLTPLALGDRSGTVVIESNDTSDSSFALHYSVEVVNPPMVSVDQPRIEFELTPGASGSQTLSLTNSGGDSLSWSLSFRQETPVTGTGAQSILPLAAPDLSAESVPGRVLVRFKPGVSQTRTNAMIAALGASVSYKSRLVDGLYALDLPQSLSAASAISTLSADERVYYAEPDYVLSLDDQDDITSSSVNDPRFGELWGLVNTGQSGGKADADIDADEAWEFSNGNHSVLVGVIDTGVDYNHPDLIDNIWVNEDEIPNNGVDDDNNGFIDDYHGWDFAYNDNNPMDVHGHGTHCSGTIGAMGNNGIGVHGVVSHVKIIPIKFLNDSGNGSTAVAVQCVEYAVLNGAHMTNNSWGGGAYSNALSDAIRAAGESSDQLFIASAGNNGRNTDTSPSYPASYPLDNIISVASTDRNDLRSSFSNYGSTSVDLGAPGSDILSTLPNGSYGTKSGTSMAGPHVVGAAALLKAFSPGSTGEQIKQALLDSVDIIPSMNGLTVSNGRLNVRSALDHVVSPWLSISPTSGSLLTDETAQIILTLDLTGLQAGRHSGYLSIVSNDPLTPRLTVPVVLFLGESHGVGTRYALWANQHFANLDENKRASTWGPNADCDRDGRANIIEYLLNSDPRQGKRAPEQVHISENHFTWRAPVNPDAVSLNFVFEVSNRLDGGWTSEGVTKRLFEDNGTHYLEFSAPFIEGSQCFGRLQVESPSAP